MKQERHGLTMIELLGVAVLIGVLTTMAVIGYQKTLHSTRQKALDDRFHIVAMAIQFYEIDHRALPSNLTDLLTTSVSGTPYIPEVPKDPFREGGGLLESEQQLGWNPSTRLLRSAGPDGERNTSDDICFHAFDLERVPC